MTGYRLAVMEASREIKDLKRGRKNGIKSAMTARGFEMPTQLELFPTTVRLTRIDPQLNMRRYYRLALQPDLVGGCTLIREWGRIGRGGQFLRQEFDNEGQAVDALLAMEGRKAKRGYRS